MVARTLVLTLTIIIGVTVPLVDAQQPARLHRVGLLFAASNFIEPFADAFRQGMRELGYIEGKNYVLEIRGVGRRSAIVFLIWPLSWFVLRLTSSSREGALRSVLPRKRATRFPSS